MAPKLRLDIFLEAPRAPLISGGAGAPQAS